MRWIHLSHTNEMYCVTFRMILYASAMIPYIGIYDLQINRLIDVCLIMWPRKRHFITNNSDISVLLTLLSFSFPKNNGKEKWKYSPIMCSLSAKLNSFAFLKKSTYAVYSIRYSELQLFQIILHESCEVSPLLHFFFGKWALYLCPWSRLTDLLLANWLPWNSNPHLMGPSPIFSLQTL